MPGGRVHDGESLLDAVRREVLEETGLVVSVGAELGVVTRGAYVIHDFAATVVGGDLAYGDDADDVRWCSADELAELPLVPLLLESLREWGVPV